MQVIGMGTILVSGVPHFNMLYPAVTFISNLFFFHCHYSSVAILLHSMIRHTSVCLKVFTSPLHITELTKITFLKLKTCLH